MGRGKWSILAIFGIAVAASAAALWYLSRQGSRSIEFWGAEHARRIVQAPRVELVPIREGAAEPDHGTLPRSIDISRSRGLMNFRRGLVTDASFDWAAGALDSPPHWDYRLQFIDDQQNETTVLVSMEGARVALAGDSRNLSFEPVTKGLRAFLSEQAKSQNAGSDDAQH